MQLASAANIVQPSDVSSISRRVESIDVDLLLSRLITMMCPWPQFSLPDLTLSDQKRFSTPFVSVAGGMRSCSVSALIAL